ncbi:MAG: FAD-dependent oxidoreductase, partial [Planctomycetota bacterium]
CNSSDVKVHGSIRVMPAAAMMGQAAGTAAAQALETGECAYELDAAGLAATLRRQGAYLPDGRNADGAALADADKPRGRA